MREASYADGVRLFSPISLFSLIDFLGVFVAAIGGALEAARNESYEYDVVGVTGLALVSALGGGVTRDLILQHGPPLAFVDVRYLLTALVGAAVTLPLVWGRGNSEPSTALQKLVLFVDAASIGLFAVAGATRAINAGLTQLPALILGVVTAAGGGALRDVLSGRTPKIFVYGQPYAIAAIFAAVVFLVADALAVPRTVATALGGVTGFAVRILALEFGWHTNAVRKGRAAGR
ncbi:MAG TPA: TRIC cation channel family protein [Terriglobales bacterium]